MSVPTNSSPTSLPSGWRKILLIRHGATALNSDDHTVDRIRGWTDYPLSAQGRKEAKALALKVPEVPDLLVYSDLQRAERTAETIAGVLDIPLLATGMDFRPWDVGIYVGANAAETIPTLACYAVNLQEIVPGGESFATFRTRFLVGLLSVLECHQGLIGIVTHHRNERLLKAWAKRGYQENGDIDLDEFTRKGEPTGHCEIIPVPVDRLKLYVDFLEAYTPAFGDGQEERWRKYMNS